MSRDLRQHTVLPAFATATEEMENSRNPIPTQLPSLSPILELPRLSAGEASVHPLGLSWGWPQGPWEEEEFYMATLNILWKDCC